MAVITANQAGGQAIVDFLDMVAYSEGTSASPVTKNSGYDVIVTGVDGPSVFTDYSRHPFDFVRPGVVVRRDPLLISTAAGRYQLLHRYWTVYRVQLKLKDFSPMSQDLIAIQQMRERHAVEMLQAGDIAGAIKACDPIWASLPGNDYGQGGHTLEDLLEKFTSFQTQTA
jgi:muramidase (phage lysozyme)